MDTKSQNIKLFQELFGLVYDLTEQPDGSHPYFDMMFDEDEDNLMREILDIPS